MTTDDAGSAREADAGSSSTPTEPAPPELKSPARRRSGRSLRAAWRAWRRSRPFWGGLLLILGGLELLALPLTGVFVRGAIKLVIYIGIGGVFGVLIGVLLIAAGIVVWVNPTHRVFYGIAGIVLGIVSFPASNLGGFLLGMLLAIIGGALAFAWVPADPDSVAAAPVGRASDDAPADRDGGGEGPVAGLNLISGTDAESEGIAPVGEDASASEGDGLRVGDATGHRMLAVAAMPAVLVAGLLGTGGAAKAVSTPQSGGNCILGILCPPTPSPSPSVSPSATPSPTTPGPTPSATASSATPSSAPSASASPSATPTAAASTSPTPTPSASASASPSASGTSTSSKGSKSKASKAARKDAATPSDLTASAAASVLSAGSATMTDFKYQGIVTMPVSGGGSEQMLEFTASSAALSGGVTVSVTQDGLTTDTNSPTLGFSGGLTLYATQLCGDIYGVLPECFTPESSSTILLDLANLLSGIAPITMTDVTTDQPLATSGALQTGSLALGF